MLFLKGRVSLSLLRTIELDYDEVGTYAMFYVMGKQLPKIFRDHYPTGGIGKVEFNKELIQDLTKNHGVTVLAKVGTTSNRGWGIDPFWKRGQELQSSIKKCSIGKSSAMDCASRAVYQHLVRRGDECCFMVMCALNSFSDSLYTTDELEQYAANDVLEKFGLRIVNDPSMFLERDMTRWSTIQLPLVIENFG